MFGAVVRRARSSAIAGADDACFSSMPRSRKAAPVRLAVDPLNGLNSLVVGKNAGNFVDSAAFCENLSRKHQQIQRFRDEFPTRPSREIILRTQGITSGFWTGPGNFAQNRSAQRPPLVLRAALQRTGSAEALDQRAAVMLGLESASTRRLR